MGRWSGEEGRYRGKLSWRWVHLSRAWKGMGVTVASRDGEGHLRQGPAGARESEWVTQFIQDTERSPDWPKQWEMRLVGRRLRPGLGEPSVRVRGSSPH